MIPNAFSVCPVQTFLLSPVSEDLRLALRKDKPKHLKTYTDRATSPDSHSPDLITRQERTIREPRAQRRCLSLRMQDVLQLSLAPAGCVLGPGLLLLCWPRDDPGGCAQGACFIQA